MKSQQSVLLVDDDEFLVGMYGMKFTKQGYAVRACLSVKDAIEAIKAGLAPDVILFDIVMPELDGFAFLQMLHDQRLAPGALKIALTNQQNDADRARIESLGGDGFLIKAMLLPSEVVESVAGILAKRTASKR